MHVICKKLKLQGNHSAPLARWLCPWKSSRALQCHKLEEFLPISTIVLSTVLDKNLWRKKQNSMKKNFTKIPCTNFAAENVQFRSSAVVDFQAKCLKKHLSTYVAFPHPFLARPRPLFIQFYLRPSFCPS